MSKPPEHDEPTLPETFTPEQKARMEEVAAEERARRHAEGHPPLSGGIKPSFRFPGAMPRHPPRAMAEDEAEKAARASREREAALERRVAVLEKALALAVLEVAALTGRVAAMESRADGEAWR